MLHGKFPPKLWGVNYTRYNLSGLVDTKGLSDLAEEILSLVSSKGQIEVKEIQQRLNITKETLSSEIDFLVESHFVQWDESRQCIRLSELCKKFLEETSEQDAGTIFILC
jgi:predicted transcriptional regulator